MRAGLRAVIFSINCFAAALLALFIAFSLNLDSPAWALTTVYITSHPLSGALRTKAIYRVAGTLLGGIAMVAIIPNLVNAPELTTLAIASWVALCLYISLLDRTPRSYVFALAGYTAALIGLPSVTNPGAVFDVALSRVEEIALGTLCAALVHSLIFPLSVSSALNGRIMSVLAEGRRRIIYGLTNAADPEIELQTRRITADISEISILGANLRYDTASHRPVRPVVRTLDERFVTLLPLLDAIADRIDALRASGPLPATITSLLKDVCAWVGAKAPLDDNPAGPLVQRCTAATPHLDVQSSWQDLVTANLMSRLIELIESWHDCLELAAKINDPSHHLDLHLKLAPASEDVKPLHIDHGIAALSALAVAVSIIACSFFWIATAWPQGAAAVSFAAVLGSLFATQDDPTPTMWRFTLLSIACLPLVGVYEFVVLPKIDDFLLLAVSLAPIFLPIGLGLASPKYTPIALPIALNVCILLALQSRYNADLASFLNTNLALIAGSIVGLITTRLLRVVSVQASARRLVRAGLRDLANLADRRLKRTRTAWASLMLDRVGLLLPRMASSGGELKLQFSDVLKDLRLGVNIIELEHVGPELERAGRQRLTQVLRGAAAYFRAVARGLHPMPGPELLAGLDALIGDVLAIPSPVSRRAGSAAAVGVRQGLYPQATPFLPQHDLPPEGKAEVAAAVETFPRSDAKSDTTPDRTSLDESKAAPPLLPGALPQHKTPTETGA